MDWLDRYEHGEFFSKDSVKLDKSTSYYTSLDVRSMVEEASCLMFSCHEIRPA